MLRRRLLRAVPATEEAGAPEEARLLAALRAGTLDAAAHAYDRWHPRVRVLARRLLGDNASAEDVVQETFVVLAKAARRYRGEPGGLESFVLGIAVKRARRHHRAAWRRRQAMDRLAAEEAGGPRTPEQDVYRRELGARLARALGRLPHAQRVAFVLCEIEDMTSGQAALVVEVPETTVRTRLFHARRRLRELLAEERAE
jgi:RNA polymerase sigma-70 factor (ECF subfamily)